MVIILGINLTIIVLLIVPILFSFILLFIEKMLVASKVKNNVAHMVAFIGSGTNFTLTATFIVWMLETKQEKISDTSILVLQMDLISLFFIMIFALVHFAVTIYCINFMNTHLDLTFFYSLLFAIYAGLNMIVMASDFFTLFIAFEGMVLCAYSMVGFYRNQEASEAGFKYLIMSSTGSLLVLYGIALLYGIAGKLDFSYLISTNLQSSIILSLSSFFLIIGFGITASIFFLNTWLPDAHPAAPPPASVILSGIVVIAGIYGILRVLIVLIIPLGTTNLVEWRNLLIIIGILTSFQGNFFVIIQFLRKDSQARNFKRILAFSTISHMGYLLTGLGTLTTLGLSGVLLHALNHAIAKGLVFMIAGYLIYVTSSYSLDNYRGLGRRDPVIGVCLVIGIFSLMSIPLTGGFWSKVLIVLGLFEIEGMFYITAGTILIGSTFFSAVGYLWIIKYIVMDHPNMEEPILQEYRKLNWRNSGAMKATIILLSIFVVILGLFPGPFLSFAIRAVNAFLL